MESEVQQQDKMHSSVLSFKAIIIETVYIYCYISFYLLSSSGPSAAYINMQSAPAEMVSLI